MLQNIKEDGPSEKVRGLEAHIEGDSGARPTLSLFCFLATVT